LHGEKELRSLGVKVGCRKGILLKEKSGRQRKKNTGRKQIRREGARHWARTVKKARRFRLIVKKAHLTAKISAGVAAQSQKRPKDAAIPVLAIPCIDVHSPRRELQALVDGGTDKKKEVLNRAVFAQCYYKPKQAKLGNLM